MTAPNLRVLPGRERRRRMSRRQYDRSVRDLAMFSIGYVVALLSIAWLVTGR